MCALISRQTPEVYDLVQGCVVYTTPRPGTVGRVIGKGGYTLRSIEAYTNTSIFICAALHDERVGSVIRIVSTDMCQAGLALAMVADVLAGRFMGLGLLRQSVRACKAPQTPAATPLYVPGYGMITVGDLRHVINDVV